MKTSLHSYFFGTQKCSLVERFYCNSQLFFLSEGKFDCHTNILIDCINCSCKICKIFKEKES